MPQLFTLGETMVQFNAVTRGPLRHVVFFEKHVAGAEANVAACLARQGYSAAYVGRVGDDEFGKAIVSWLRGMGVDVSHVKVDASAPTGIYFVQRDFPIPGRSRVFYYRKGSAGSRVSPEDVDEELVASARIVHLTGITPALSESAHNACKKTVELAQKHGALISFDTNIRPPLWRSMDEAAEKLRYFIERADILFVDSADARIIVGEEEPDRVVRAFQNLGVDTIVMKLGPSGALAVRGGERAREQAVQVPVEDTIGAGNALAGTFLGCFVLGGASLGEALRKAVLAGSLVVMTRGDQENLPTLEELESLEKAVR